MKLSLTFPSVALAAGMFIGCAASPEPGVDDAYPAGTAREQGTTGLGVGSDTTTQTGIDTGTRSGSGIGPR